MITGHDESAKRLGGYHATMTTPREPAFFRKHREREERLWQELGRARPTDVIGVVRPRGVGGSQSQGARQWTLQIELMAWRAGDGPVSKQPLVARQRTSERAVVRAMDEISAYDIVRMRARVAVENSFGSPQAKIVRMLEPVDDREIAATADSLKKPVVVEDEQFGKLKFDRAAGWFTAQARWGRRRIEVNLVANRSTAHGKSLQHAKAIFAAHREWAPQLAERIADLHSLWLESWREADDKRLTAKQFAAKIRVESVTVEQSGAFEFWFDDGDLFGGHSVVVSGSLKRGVKEATIEG